MFVGRKIGREDFASDVEHRAFFMRRFHMTNIFAKVWGGDLSIPTPLAWSLNRELRFINLLITSFWKKIFSTRTLLQRLESGMKCIEQKT